MRPPGTTVSVEDFHALDREDQIRLEAWMGDVIGRPLPDAYVFSARLGEGILEVEHLDIDPSGRLRRHPEDPERFATYRHVYPAPTLPPVWPAGLADARP